MLLFSLAGIPPFIGFFFKLNLIYFVNLSSFLLFFILFFYLFASLYFYLQNLKFLLIVNNVFFKNNNYFFNNQTFFVLQFSIFSIFVITAGSLFLDDIILVFFWLLS